MSAYWSTAFDGREHHRPADSQTLRCAALELRQRGLTERDIAQALRIGEGAVRTLLADAA
ncbi:MAG: hypothetical protein M0038_09140 [Pseudomonadota bacterium]|jgi:orotate phosphoribosyltransferase-like protein|nr:hypothetical protein [Pseudomonadota bacterium]